MIPKHVILLVAMLLVAGLAASGLYVTAGGPSKEPVKQSMQNGPNGCC
ncbi:hypothetical protein [Streptomyces pseudovenezuelae]|uniref:Uncharacterized protein n=1 Tax=Streptomyces pseudovenezuelae TaxID=67350 RepID=A0ABT6LKR4_9ACTN|nr:hypothetical protein [Streptomyces pseudovenezuelae]MDH6216900.1 hypothetical protein [Streptomyces pseudovenezuelae]